MITVLLAFFVVCEVLAACGVPSGRFNLTAAGLAFYATALILGASGLLIR